VNLSTRSVEMEAVQARARLRRSFDSMAGAMAFHIRDAQEDDVSALTRLHVRTFNETHRGGLGGGPSYELRECQWREAFANTDGRWFCFVVEDDNGETSPRKPKGTHHFARTTARFLGPCLGLLLGNCEQSGRVKSIGSDFHLDIDAEELLATDLARKAQIVTRPES
jgi:hypothetical protein